MIKLREIPIGEVSTQLLANEYVYCKSKTSALNRVNGETQIRLKDINKVMFYIEDTSEGESELTYGNLYYEFLKQHETIKHVISDYRPANKPFTLFVWLKDVPFCFEVTFLHEFKVFQWRVTSND